MSNRRNSSEMSHTFPRTVRLRRQGEFDRVYRANAYAADRTLVIQAVANGEDTTRLGLSVSTRVGNAVVRNRWKRLIREAFRLQRHELPVGYDLVARPRRGARPSFRDIERSLPQLLRRLDRQWKRGMRGKRGTRRKGGER